MAQDIVNHNQNISYTNLDFSSIYEETLDLVKKLTYKWDPSISNESDPGVILLKLSALIADKANYNIDKSVLETFPLSVTQDGNARQLYEQLGYYMNWYESATLPVTLAWKGAKDNNEIKTYTVPKFSVITDSENKVNYTIIGTENEKGLVVSDGKLSTDGNTIKLIAMEGTPTQYSFLGEHIITPQMVDNDNRLYFTTQYVSQNGVFIKNTGQENYSSWKRVDNLYEQTFNELRYKFGYDSKSNLAYIEFPDNYEQLMGSGIEITYLIINPNYNEVPTQTIDRFLVAITPKESSDVSLSFDTVKMMNISASSGHKEKESINEAYTNYQKVVGTFKTLVTLRDYINYINKNASELCSNVIVTDRTNDPQSTYKIVGKERGIDVVSTEVEKNTTNGFDLVVTKDQKYNSSKTYYYFDNSGSLKKNESGKFVEGTSYYELAPRSTDRLTPFSLKFYFLQKGISLNSRNSYNESFNLTTDTPSIENLIEGTKHLEHTYEDILPLGENTYKLTEDTTNNFNKSYYTFNSKTKEYTLATSQYYQQTADSSFDKNKSYYLKVGGTFKLVNDNPQLIGMCDEPAKTKDETWVTDKEYYLFSNSGLLKSFTRQMPVSGKTPKELGLYEKPTTTTKTEWAPTETLYIEVTPGRYIGTRPSPSIFPLYEQVSIAYGNPKKMGLYELDVEALLYHVIMYKAKYPVSMNISTYDSVGADTQTDILNNVINAFYKYTRSEEMKFGEPISIDYLTEIVKKADARIKNVAFDSINYEIEAVHYDKGTGKFVTTKLPKSLGTLNPSDMTNIDEVRGYYLAKELVSKSILAGVTQLLVPDTQFEYHINQRFKDYVDNIGQISGEATLSLANQQTTYAGIDQVRKTYTLQENEILTLFKPALDNIKSFGSGIHFECVLNNDILDNQVHQLQEGEYIFFYNPNVNDSGSITGYTVSCYSKGSIIQPSFKIEKQQELKALSNYALQSALVALEQSKEDYVETVVTNSYWVSEIRSSSAIINNVISGSSTVGIKKLNRITINPQDGYKFYWVLDKTTYSNSDNIKNYVLFDEFDSDYDTAQNNKINTYTLKNGEYLYYTNADNTDLVILGAGTSITRNCGLDSKAIEISEVPYEFVLTTDVGHDFEFVKQVHNGVLVINPKESGLYEYTNGSYVRTEDTAEISSKQYYVLCMKNVAGMYTQVRTLDTAGKPQYTYAPTSDTTDTVFVQYNTSNAVSDIDPSSLNLYEVITNNNIPFVDRYQMSGNSYKGSYKRFAQTLDKSIITQRIFKGDASSIDINDVMTYKSITLDENSANYYSPATLGLLQSAPDTVKKLKTYYKKTGTSFVEATDVTKDTIPSSSGTLYEKIGNTYKLTSDIFSWKPEKYIPEVSTTPFRAINDVKLGDNIANSGYYYKNALADTTYVYDSMHTVAGLQASAYTLTALTSIYNQVISKDTTSETLVSRLNSSWQTTITHALPGQWKLCVFKATGSEWTAGTSTSYPGDVWVLIPEEMLTNSSIVRGLSVVSQISPSIIKYNTETFEKGIFVLFNDIKAYIPTEESKKYKLYTKQAEFVSIEDTTDAQLSFARMQNLHQTMSILTLQNNSSRILDKFVVYYMPLYYKFKQLYKRIDKVYYKLDTYYKKSFPKVASWSCTALDLSDIASDPIEALRKSWQQMQTNTSITITENSLVTLAEGDKFTMLSPSAYDFNVNWVTFNNSETPLDLKAYNCSYKKQGQEEVQLNELTIPNCAWRGYSNLLINTSTTQGQHLKDNHELRIYDDSDEHKLLSTISNTYFQLAHPVQNKTGTYIDVHTYDILGNKILNTLYAYDLELDNEEIKYTTDKFETYLNLSKNGHATTLPFNLPFGNYIIPFTGTEESQVTLKYVLIHKETTTEIYSKQLTNYINGESLFVGDKFRFISVPVSRVIQIIDPASITKALNKTPKQMGNWYADKDLTNLSDSNNKGDSLAQRVSSPSGNPQEQGWYELVSGSYVLTQDNIVISGKDYYSQHEFYVKSSDYYGCILVTETNNKELSVKLGDLFRYENNPLLGTSFESIAQKIKRLDKEEKFNYTHVPKASDLIADPLVPKTFWLNNHIANKFTIAQMDFEKEESIEYKFIN